MKIIVVICLSIITSVSLLVNGKNLEDHAFAKAENTSSITYSTFISKPVKEPSTIRVALLLDTSNSMDGLIDQARAQLWELVNELSQAKCGNQEHPNLNIALYEYGNDNLNAKEGYIRQVNNFSSDLDEISKSLFALTTNGGNEYCGNVIQSSLNQLNWGTQPTDLNLIFIAGNEGFDQGPVAYKEAANNACGKDVTINTIFCGDYNAGVNSYWKDGATLTQGDYIAINSDKATVHIPSPYDDEILQKNRALNRTYVKYGALGDSKKDLQAAQDTNAAGYGEANAVKRAVSKSSRFYKNSSWDLVDAIDEDEEVVNTIDEEALPEELKGKSTSEIKTYLEKKKKERVTIQKEIAELNIKRKAYVSEKSSKEDNELRNALIDAIKKQGKIKSYSWE